MKDVVPEHHIQMKLFNALVQSDVLRYSELKPKLLEANLFMYHLKELIKMGLVEKVEKGYSLTPAGKSTATRFSIREQMIRIMPTVVSVLALTSEDGEILVYRRKRHPFINYLSLPSGKIHLGDALHDAAYRELKEKCGYERDDVELKYRGVYNLVEKEGDGLKNHIIGHLWSGLVTNKKIFDQHAGTTFWADWEQQPYEEFISGFKEIMNALEKPEFFGLELNFTTVE